MEVWLFDQKFKLLLVTQYLIETRERIFSKGYYFCLLLKIWVGKNIGKDISKKLSGKNSQKIPDYVKQSATDPLEAISKRVIQQKQKQHIV